MIAKKSIKMFVQLANEYDISRFQQMTKSEQFEQLQNSKEVIFFEVESFSEASILCKQYINKFNFCSSNWSGGLIVDEDFNFIANVSFNGRIWDNEDWFKAKEILC